MQGKAYQWCHRSGCNSFKATAAPTREELLPLHSLRFSGAVSSPPPPPPSPDFSTPALGQHLRFDQVMAQMKGTANNSVRSSGPQGQHFPARQILGKQLKHESKLNAKFSSTDVPLKVLPASNSPRPQTCSNGRYRFC